MTVVLPGDVLSPRLSDSSQQSLPVKLGPGLLPSNSKSSSITATRAGVIGHIPPKGKGKNRAEGWWVESNSKRVSTSRVEYRMKGTKLDFLCKAQPWKSKVGSMRFFSLFHQISQSEREGEGIIHKPFSKSQLFIFPLSLSLSVFSLSWRFSHRSSPKHG